MAVRDMWDPQLALDQTDQYVSFAFLVTALLFARSACTPAAPSARA